MKTKLVGFIFATVLASTVTAVPALAGPITWDFNSLLQSSGATPNASLRTFDTSFTQGSQTIEASSVVDNCTPSGCWGAATLDLWYKDGSTASEQGLGLAGDPYGSGGEIYNPYGIELDLTGPNAYFGSIGIGSAQTGETYQVWGYNGTSWVSLQVGAGGDTVNVDVGGYGSFQNLVISDPYTAGQTQTNSNDIVLMSATTTAPTVPEPGSLALFGAGVLGLAWVMGQRKRRELPLA